MAQSDPIKAQRKAAAAAANERGSFTKTDYGWRKRRPRVWIWAVSAAALVATPFIFAYHRLQRWKTPAAAPAVKNP